MIKEPYIDGSYHFSVLGNDFKVNEHGITCNDYIHLEIRLHQDWKRVGAYSDMFYWGGIYSHDVLCVDFPEIYDCKSYKIGKDIKFKSYEHFKGYSGFMGGGYKPEKLEVYFEVKGLFFTTTYKYKLIVDALDTETMYGELYKNGNLVERTRPKHLYISDN